MHGAQRELGYSKETLTTAGALGALFCRTINVVTIQHESGKKKRVWSANDPGGGGGRIPHKY